jgi:small subunit ribosomal protein S16
MEVKIRLQRHGKKGAPFYHIVVADARAARDGKFIEKLGTYDPMTNPATIELNAESACKWLKNGAQPTETARNILSYKGVLLRRHLQIGVEKGAITQEVADKRFEAWMIEKQNKISAKQESCRNAQKEDAKQRLAKESEVNAAKAAAIAKKREEAAAAQAAAAEEVPATEEAVAETAETPAE